jgi:hypothetical protein
VKNGLGTVGKRFLKDRKVETKELIQIHKTQKLFGGKKNQEADKHRDDNNQKNLIPLPQKSFLVLSQRAFD